MGFWKYSGRILHTTTYLFSEPVLTLTNAPNGQLRVDQADYVPASVLTNLVVIAAIVQKAIRPAQMEEAAPVSVCLKKNCTIMFVFG